MDEKSAQMEKSIQETKMKALDELFNIQKEMEEMGVVLSVKEK